MNRALGIIEAVGLTTAVTALDAAVKTASVELIGTDKVIGVDKAVSVVLYVAGNVSDVRTAVDAAVNRANQVGKISGSHVIARPHEELDKIIAKITEKQKLNETDAEKAEELKQVVKKKQNKN